jgi:hypothetical protein
MRGSDRSHREGSRQEVFHRAIADREIEDFMDKVSMHYEITKHDFLMGQGTAGTAEGSTVDRWHGYRDIASFVDKVSMHYEIANPEIRRN